MTADTPFMSARAPPFDATPPMAAYPINTSLTGVPPPPPPPPAAAPLPPGWQELYDPGSRRAYYMRVGSHETTWERPVASKGGESFRVLPAAAAAPPSQGGGAPAGGPPAAGGPAAYAADGGPAPDWREPGPGYGDAVGGGYPPGEAGHPPGGTSYPPGGTSYPPGGTSCPPGGTGYPPGGTGYPPGGGGYPSSGGGYPSDGGGYPPGGEGYPSAGGHPPAGRGYPSAGGYGGGQSSQGQPGATGGHPAGGRYAYPPGAYGPPPTQYGEQADRRPYDHQGQPGLAVYPGGASAASCAWTDAGGLVVDERVDAVGAAVEGMTLGGGGRLVTRTSAMVNAATMGAARDGVSASLSLELSATNLRNKDLRGKSDPVVVVEMQDERGRWVKTGQTEIIENNLNPHWAKRVVVDYVFEKVQLLRFTVSDVDRVTRDGSTVLKTEFLGQLTKALGDLLVSGTATYDLTGRPTAGRGQATPDAASRKNYGRFCVRVHETGGARSFHRVHCTLSAKGLDRADGLFGKSDPYVTVKQVSGAGQSGVNVLKVSNVVRQKLDPRWAPMVFDVQAGGGGLAAVQLELSIMDWDKGQEHDPLGAVKCTLAELTAPGAGPFDVINVASKKHKQAGYRNSGQLFVDRAVAVEYPSHIAYLQGGTRIQVMCAVDMTRTGGPPTDPASPHFCSREVPSMYARALRAVGDVVKPFLPDDQMIHAYGFGATHTFSGGRVSDAFPLNPAVWNEAANPDARVQGADNLVRAYEACVQAATFGEPARLAEVLGRAIGFSTSPRPTQEAQHYTVLLILTQGGCADMDATIRKICEASEVAPLSVVIVGVGDRANWKNMEGLDGDDGRLPRTSDGKTVAKRDIVDFVKYDPAKGPDALAAEVLREVPNALREYFVEHGIRPNSTPRPPYG